MRSHWVQLGFLCLGSVLLMACQTQRSDWSHDHVVLLRQRARHEPHLEINTQWLNLGLPEVRVIDGIGATSYDYETVKSSLTQTAPALAEKFATIDNYRDYSVNGFLIGLLGMAGSLAAADRHVPRTIGNAVWGVSWLVWLGFAAITGEDLQDIAKSFRLQPYERKIP